MKVLLVGGSGLVGSFITPYLKKEHEIRVFDLVSPEDKEVEFIEGSVTDPHSIEKALQGVDAFIWLVMKSGQGGKVTDQDVKVIQENYEVNCLGLHMFMYLAQKQGINKGVYTSSMSVHYRSRDYYHSEEEIPLDTPSVYGLSKGFGERICRYFVRWFDMSVISLRITGPATRKKWINERRTPTHIRPDGLPELFWTDEEDLSSAYLLALDHLTTGGSRFEAFFIAGDEQNIEHNLTKAKRILGWEPKTHLKIN